MNDLFDTTNQADHNQIPENPLDALVGEGKKFKTVDELAKAKWESDQYIKTLEQGRDQLREDYLKALEAAQTGPQVKELLDQLKNQNTQQATLPNANDVTAPTLDPIKAKEIAMQTYQELEAQRKAQANYTEVETKLKETYGTNYREVFQQKVRELGLSMDWAKQTALEHPVVLYKTLGLDQPSAGQFQAPPTSRQRTDNFAPHVEKRDWDYYEKMRVNNPTQYWNPKTQVQLHQDTQQPWFKTQSYHNS